MSVLTNVEGLEGECVIHDHLLSLTFIRLGNDLLHKHTSVCNQCDRRQKDSEKGLRKIAVGEVMVVDVTERLLRMEALTCT